MGDHDSYSDKRADAQRAEAPSTAGEDSHPHPDPLPADWAREYSINRVCHLTLARLWERAGMRVPSVLV